MVESDEGDALGRFPQLTGGVETPADGFGETLAEMFGAVGRNVAKGSLELFQRLGPVARQHFLSVVEPSLRDSDVEALNALYALDYERKPPTPEEFLDSSDYFGHYKDELFPAWRPHIIHACRPSNRVHELILTGAQALGKTTAGSIVLAYKIARLLCLRQPAAFYGLAPRAQIFFGLYATTKALIRQVGFYELRDVLIDQSPFFRYVYPRLNQGKEFIRWQQKRIEVITGSSEMHALGRNLFAVLADELNYFVRGEKTETRARELVAEVSRRLESRFVQAGGDVPGCAIYVSQTRTTSDYLEQRIRQQKGVKGVYVVRGPRWAFNTLGYHAVRNRGHRPGDPTFRVLIPTETTDPAILDRVVQLPTGQTVVQTIDATRDKRLDPSLVLHVPTLHYRAFMDDINGALRNIADVPTGSFTPFFPRREVIEQSFDETLPYPFNAQEVPCYEGGTTRLQDAFDHKMVTRIGMGRLEPVRHPEAPRYIHLDLSQGGDRTGFVMVHPSGHYIAEREVEDDSARVGESEVVKTVEVDFHIALIGGPFGEGIDYRKVRVFIDWLRRCGFWIRLVTADQYMSYDHLMRLRDAGFQAGLQSTDRNSKPYRDARQAMTEGRVAVPWPTGLLGAARIRALLKAEGAGGAVEEALTRVILYQELAGLEHDVKRDKIDHRARNPDGTKGSKDVADGLAGAVFRCLTDEVRPKDAPTARSPRQAVADKYNRYLRALQRGGT